ncbi:MAG: cell division protein FtsZ [Bacteroidaceae bacterium]|nr:cell division protein FtsZ [Bacteroidaceae bacterium]
MNEKIMAFESEGTLPFDFPTESRKIIKVIGVGGGGGNAVRNMYHEGIRDVVFVVANTDQQALADSEIPIKLQLGRETTKGLGAGNDPEVARQAAEESIEDIRAQFKDDTQMVFITAGMGGGTGTGAAPVIARVAREMGMLTVGIVTIPFKFEMRRKIKQALRGVRELSQYVDALLVISNEKLLELCPGTSVSDGFKRADQTLTTATKSIAELITCRGIINLDFRDVRKILTDGGVAIMSEGAASGENRVALAFEAALHSPLLYNNDIHKSGKILFNIYQTNDASQHLQLDEINEIRHFMDKFVDKNIEVIWGLAIDDNLKEGIRIAVLATGFGVDSIPMIDDDDEAGAQSIIDRIYDENSTSSKLLCLYELDDSDLDNAVLIDAIASRPAFSRTTQDINDFKTMRKSAAN